MGGGAQSGYFLPISSQCFCRSSSGVSALKTSLPSTETIASEPPPVVEPAWVNARGENVN